jgi:hypothetical protein
VDETFGRAILTWTDTNTNPAVTYQVTSSTGGGTWDVGTEKRAIRNSVTGSGYIDAQIKAGFANAYYKTSEAKYVAPVKYSVKTLDNLSANLSSVTRSGNTNQVVIRYGETSGATDYILEKAKIDGTTSSQVNYTWVPVTATPVFVSVSSWEKVYEVIDTITADAYAYRLFVRNASGISSASVNDYSVTAVKPGVNANLSVSSSGTQLKTADINGDGIDTSRYTIKYTISNVENGVTYTLWTQTYGDATGSGDERGEWTSSGLSVTANASETALTVVFDPLEKQRQKYDVKVIGTKDGLIAAESGQNYSYSSAKDALSVYGGSADITAIGVVTGVSVYNSATSNASLQSNETIEVYAQKITTATGVIGNYELAYTITAPTSGALAVDKTATAAGTGKTWYSSSTLQFVTKVN